jgi:hypothetical protein
VTVSFIRPVLLVEETGVPGDFDKKIKREYLGRIIDNVDFFS